MTRALNIWTALCACVVLFWSAALAQAQEPQRVAIREFTGGSAGAVQAAVTQGLKQRDDISVVSARELSATASRLGSDLDSSSGVKEVAEALELSAIVEGEVDKKGRDLKVTLRVRNGATGEVTKEETLNRRRSQVRALKGQTWGLLGASIGKSSPPKPAAASKPSKQKPEPVVADPEQGDEALDDQPEPAPKPVARPSRRPRPASRDESDESDEEPARARAAGDKSADHPALVASLGLRWMWRDLQYDGATNLGNYSNAPGKPATLPVIALQYYPGAHTSSAWYSNLGLDLEADFAVGGASKIKSTGEEVDTSAYSFGLGLIYRLPLGDFEPRLRLGYLRQKFDVDVPENVYMPAVTYSALRIGVGTAIHLVEWLSLDFNFAYLPVLGTGELDDKQWGNDVDSRGFEAGAGFLVRFKEVYGVRVGLDYRRFKYDFANAYEPTDMVPDPATMTPTLVNVQLPKTGTDGYLMATLAFVYQLPGVK